MQTNARLAAVGLAVLAAGAAAAQSRPVELPVSPASRGGPGGPAAELNVFVSPAGKAYRARPGETYPVAAWFASADADHDGKLTQAEFRADAEAFFHELDTNHDGLIDGFEINDYEKAMPEMAPQVGELVAGEGQDPDLGDPDAARHRHQIGGKGPRSRTERGPRDGLSTYSLLREPEPVTAADADLDGHVSLQEALAAADRRFAQLDTKHQGYLTLADLPKTEAQLQIERRLAQLRKKGGDKPPPVP